MRIIGAIVLSLFITTPALACYEQAAKAYRVDKNLLLAIAYIESRWKPNAINVNKNGSEDLCAFQINDFHLPEIAAFGIDDFQPRVAIAFFGDPEFSSRDRLGQVEQLRATSEIQRLVCWQCSACL